MLNYILNIRKQFLTLRTFCHHLLIYCLNTKFEMCRSVGIIKHLKNMHLDEFKLQWSLWNLAKKFPFQHYQNPLHYKLSISLGNAYITLNFNFNTCFILCLALPSLVCYVELKMPYSIHFISLNKECRIATLHFTLNVASMPVATIIKYKFYSVLSNSQIRMNSNPVKCSYIKQSNSDAE